MSENIKDLQSKITESAIKAIDLQLILWLGAKRKSFC